MTTQVSHHHKFGDPYGSDNWVFNYFNDKSESGATTTHYNFTSWLTFSLVLLTTFAVCFPHSQNSPCVLCNIQ